MVKKALAALSFALSTGVAQANAPDAKGSESSGLDPRRASERELDGTVAQELPIEFTAVFIKSPHGYVGFVEELPGVNSHGRTLDEAREMLGQVAVAVFDAERQRAQEMLAGKECVREPLAMARQMREGE
jgi:predicted RNase H-like HicB family nuclease